MKHVAQPLGVLKGMAGYPLIPQNSDDFKKIITGMYQVLNSALYREDNTREWGCEDLLVLSWVFKNFAENNGYNWNENERYQQFVENYLDKIMRSFKPHKNKDYIVQLMKLVGINPDPSDKDFNFLFTKPWTDFITKKNLLYKGTKWSLFDKILIYLIISYMYNNSIQSDENSEKFCEEFIHYHKEHGTWNNIAEELDKKLGKNPNAEKFIDFYLDLYNKVKRLYTKWWCVRDLNISDILFVKLLIGENEEFEYDSPIQVANGVVIDCKFAYTQKTNSEKKRVNEDVYTLHVFCKDTAKVCKFMFHWNKDVKKTPFNFPGIGMNVRISGKYSHKVLTRVSLVNNKKVFTFDPINLKNVDLIPIDFNDSAQETS